MQRFFQQCLVHCRCYFWDNFGSNHFPLVVTGHMSRWGEFSVWGLHWCDFTFWFAVYTGVISRCDFTFWFAGYGMFFTEDCGSTGNCSQAGWYMTACKIHQSDLAWALWAATFKLWPLDALLFSVKRRIVSYVRFLRFILRRTQDIVHDNLNLFLFLNVVPKMGLSCCTLMDFKWRRRQRWTWG